LAQVAKAKGYNSVCDMLRTIEGESYEMPKHNPVENHIELQNSNVVGFNDTQLNIDNLNDKAVLDDHKNENNVEKLKSMKKEEEHCNSTTFIEEHRETSEMIINKLYKKLMLSTLSEEDN